MSFTKDASFERDTQTTSIPQERHNTLNKLFPSRITENNKVKPGSIDAQILLSQYNPKKERRPSFAPKTDVPPVESPDLKQLPSPSPARRRSSIVPFINAKAEINSVVVSDSV